MTGDARRLLVKLREAIYDPVDNRCVNCGVHRLDAFAHRSTGCALDDAMRELEAALSPEAVPSAPAKRCTCWLSTSATSGSSEARERCAVHGVPSAPAGLKVRVSNSLCSECGTPLVWTATWQGWDCVVCIRRDRDQRAEDTP